MKKIMLALSALIAIVCISLVACSDKSSPEIAVVISQDSLVKRGSYLVNAMGCDDCHTPKKMGPHGPEPDMALRFSGHVAGQPLGRIDPNVMKEGWVLFNMGLTAFVGPWGTSYAANISGDDTGIGNWTEKQFLTAIRDGKAKGIVENRNLLPPMPWQVYRNLNDTDLKAIFAYLKTSKPQANRVPGPQALAELKH